MTVTLSAILALVSIVATVLLSVNAWVQHVTGKKSLDTRVADLEEKLRIASVRFSEKWGEIQTGLGSVEVTQARQEEHFKATDARVTRLEEKLK